MCFQVKGALFVYPLPQNRRLGMSYENKLGRAFKELEAANIWKCNYNPPLHKWLRRAGLRLRPPFYVSFARNLLIRFFEFFIFYFPILSLLRVESTISNLLFESIITSVFYSLVMCSYYRWTFRRCEFTCWEKL
ncbi:DUF6404 family protein [Vibrio vulnificus]|uniref:DUF6404 family protein n=2 Tax=Vibrio vulnificus TaxID=672 RepID=UPI0030F8FAA8